jgi:hypothetical protein
VAFAAAVLCSAGFGWTASGATSTSWLDPQTVIGLITSATGLLVALEAYRRTRQPEGAHRRRGRS